MRLCPACAGNKPVKRVTGKVTDSRVDKFGCVRRRRRCLECGHRWVTTEVTTSSDSRAVKEAISNVLVMLSAVESRVAALRAAIEKIKPGGRDEDD